MCCLCVACKDNVVYLVHRCRMVYVRVDLADVVEVAVWVDARDGHLLVLVQQAVYVELGFHQLQPLVAERSRWGVKNDFHGASHVIVEFRARSRRRKCATVFIFFLKQR